MIPYNLLLNVIDSNLSPNIINYIIKLFNYNLNHSYDSTILPIYLAVKNNNFTIANTLLDCGADINHLNDYGGNILSFLLVEFLNKENLNYIIDKGIDINYNLYHNNIKSLLSFSNNSDKEYEISNFFNPTKLNDGVTVTCFDYILYEASKSHKDERLNLLEEIIKCKSFKIEKINKKSIELILKNKFNSIMELLIQYKPTFINCGLFELTLKEACESDDFYFLNFLIEVINKYKLFKFSDYKITLSTIINMIISYSFSHKSYLLLNSLRGWTDDRIINVIIDDFTIIYEEYNLFDIDPLHKACTNKDYVLIDYLLKLNYNVNIKNVKGETPLMVSLKNERYDVVKLLLNNAKNINVNIEDKNNETPIIYMINNKQSINCEIFKELIFHGADLSLKYKNNIPLVVAIMKKNVEYIKILLEQPSFSFNQLYNGKTIMSWLIDYIIDDEKIYDFLFEKKAYIDFEYVNNMPRSKASLIEKNLGLIKSISKFGFYTNQFGGSRIVHIKTPVIFFLNITKNNIALKIIDNNMSLIEEKDEEGMTPIFHTIRGSNQKLFNILLNKYHADINVKNKNGKTPLSYTISLTKTKCDNNRKKILSILKEKGTVNLSTQQNVKINENKKLDLNNNLKYDNENKKLNNLKKKKSLKQIKEEQLIQEKPTYINEAIHNKVNINSYLDSGTMIDPTQNNTDSLLIKVDDDDDDKDGNVILDKKDFYEYINRYNNDDDDDDSVDSFELNLEDDIYKNEFISNNILSLSNSDENIYDDETSSKISVKNSVPEKNNNITTSIDHDNNILIQNQSNNEENNKENIEIPSQHCIEESTETPLQVDKIKDIEHYPELHISCLCEQIDFIRLFINDYLFDINETCQDGSTPIFISIKFGKIKSIKELLSHHPDLTIPDNNGETPISYLLKHPSPINDKILEIILPEVNINILYPQFSSDDEKEIFYLIKQNNIKGIQLISKCKDFNIEEVDKNGNTPLLFAIKQSSININLIETLLFCGANVNHIDKNGKISLFYAIEACNPELVKLLIEYNVDINFVLSNGLNPLKLAIKMNNVPIAKAILEKKKKLIVK